MDCTVTHFRKVSRDGAMPYYVIKATGQKGDPNAAPFDEDGFINPLAMQSRTYLFTKTLFPANETQCKLTEEGYKCDDDGKVLDGKKVRLMLHQWLPGKKFYIFNKERQEFYQNVTQETVEVIAERDEIVDGKIVKKGEKYTKMVETSKPKVFDTITLTLFCDKEEKSVEGNPDELAKANWESGLKNGIYIIVDEK